MTNQEIQMLLDKQRAYYRSGATLPVAFRIEQLRRLYATVEKYQDEICDALIKATWISSHEYGREHSELLQPLMEDEAPDVFYLSDLKIMMDYRLQSDVLEALNSTFKTQREASIFTRPSRGFASMTFPDPSGVITLLSTLGVLLDSS